MNFRNLVVVSIVICVVSLSGCRVAVSATNTIEPVRDPQAFADILLSRAENDAERKQARERINNLVGFNELKRVETPLILTPYKLNVNTVVREFTPRIMPDHRCVYVEGTREGGLYCTAYYGDL
ncbi:hypothetical protein [Vibrio phage vB_ValS_PJ32]|nr:hypothetical protein [Vibrio phage vB_ValS_PJ32]